MTMFRIATIALAATMFAGPALAQHGPFPKQAVEACLRAQFDAKTAAPIVGSWYGEFTDGSGAVSRQVQQYTADGQFFYSDLVCGAYSCSRNDGNGLYGVNAQGGGNYYVARIFNDLQRTNWCQGAQVQVIDPKTIRLPDGNIMRKMPQ